MLDAVKAQTLAIAGQASADASVATFVRFEGPMCIVIDGLGVEQSYRWAGMIVPAPGDSVQLQVLNGAHVVVGRTLPTPTQGRVAAVASGEVQVNVDIGPSPITAQPLYSNPAVGDVVALIYGGEGFLALGKSSPKPAPPPPSPSDPAPAPTTTKRVFRARVAGNWRNGDWGSGRPIVSDYRVAAWHYGDILGKTLPDDAEIVRCRMYLPTTQVLYPNAPIVQALASPPPSQAGAGPTGVLPARQGWVDIPRQVAEQLRAGNRGIRLSVNSANGGGTHDMYKPLSEDPMSGALEITWRS